MTCAIGPEDTLYRTVDWIESIELRTTDPAGYDFSGCPVVAVLRKVDDPDAGITASIADGTIDAETVTGLTARFVIRIQQAAFAAACPWGDYDLEVRISINGDDIVLLRAPRLVRDGVTL